MPLRSPFRYPGGKTWLVPRIRQWLTQSAGKAEFIEPFVGGGIVSLTVAFEKLADRVTMVEIDSDVAAVWQTLLDRCDRAWLQERISTFKISPDAVNSVLDAVPVDLKEKAFQTILKNRVNRGGILAAGAGKIKRGEKDKGLKSRWYPETLKRRILNIEQICDRLTFIAGDGMEFLRQNSHRSDAVFFIDPPYTAAGKKAGSRLYTHWELDHEELFRISSTLSGDFLMTYDNVKEVRQLADKFGLDTETVPMKNTHHAKMTELLIGRNLDWVRSR
ncbi:MAG: DNA adenine methylase [Hormoscilla sp. GUM202]|nr:DNA adenine methylase [Hormoscilla sp. GUM202]